MFPVFMFYEAELDQVSKFKARSDLAFMINPWLDFMTYMMTLGTILLIICFFVLLLPVKSYCKVAITQLFYNHLEKKIKKSSPHRFPFSFPVYMRWKEANSFSSPSVPTTAHFREVFATTTTTTIYYTATSDWLLSKWRSRWSQRKCNLLLLLHFHFHFLNHCRLHHV